MLEIVYTVLQLMEVKELRIKVATQPFEIVYALLIFWIR